MTRPPFAIALLSSFYAGADPILATRGAKVSKKADNLALLNVRQQPAPISRYAANWPLLEGVALAQRPPSKPVGVNAGMVNVEIVEHGDAIRLILPRDGVRPLAEKIKALRPVEKPQK